MSRKNPTLTLTVLIAAVLVVPVALGTAEAGDLFLVDSAGLYTLDTANAKKTLVGPGPCDGLALSPAPSRYFYCSLSREASGGFLYALNTDGSGLTYLLMIQGDADRGLAFNTATGILYGTDNHSFGSIDPLTGTFTPLASPVTEPESLAADPVNNLVYGLDRDEMLISYDVATDLWIPLAPTAVGDGGKGGLAFDPISGLLYFIETGGDLFSIDPADASTVFLGTVPDMDEFAGLTYLPSYDPVPEVKVNGLDGPVAASLSERFFLTVALAAGELLGTDVELWIVAKTPRGWMHYDWNGGVWAKGTAASYQGPLFEIDTQVVWDSSLPPASVSGKYTFLFAVDMTIDGIFDRFGSPQDLVVVQVDP